MNIVESFDQLSLSRLNEYKALKQEEHLFLDFKLVSNPALVSRDDRRNLAKALSGFANSSGGLVVWGVDARKNAEGIDCAVDLREIPDVRRFLTRLNELTGEAVDPVVSGVQHRVIETSGGKGFAVSLIPEGDSGPHMAKLGEDRYYKRSGAGFYMMEHFDIADMFAKRRKPKLVVVSRVQGSSRDAEIIISLRNDGRASANAPYLAFGCSGPFFRRFYGLDGNGNDGLPFLRVSNAGYPWCFGGGMHFAIHPGMTQDVTLLHLGHSPKALPSEDVKINYAVACEDQPLTKGTLVIPLHQVA